MLKTLFVTAATVAALSAQGVDKSDPTTVMTVERQARKARAGEWLASGDPLNVAWGAWTARADRQADLVPMLIDRIREYRSSGMVPTGGFALDQHDAMLQVLDTLIELKAQVPPEEARKLYPEFVAQSVILLVRAGDNAVPALMEIFDTAGGNTSWLAAGNALLGAHAEGFGVKVLAKYTEHLQVKVLPPGWFGDGSGGGAICGALYLPPSKSNWPGVHESRGRWTRGSRHVAGTVPRHHARTRAKFQLPRSYLGRVNQRIPGR